MIAVNADCKLTPIVFSREQLELKRATHRPVGTSQNDLGWVPSTALTEYKLGSGTFALVGAELFQADIVSPVQVDSSPSDAVLKNRSAPFPEAGVDVPVGDAVVVADTELPLDGVAEDEMTEVPVAVNDTECVSIAIGASLLLHEIITNPLYPGRPPGARYPGLEKWGELTSEHALYLPLSHSQARTYFHLLQTAHQP